MAKHFHHLHALTAALLVYLAQSKRLLADRPGPPAVIILTVVGLVLGGMVWSQRQAPQVPLAANPPVSSGLACGMRSVFMAAIVTHFVSSWYSLSHLELCSDNGFDCVQFHGFIQFSTFTRWSYILIGIYFVAANLQHFDYVPVRWTQVQQLPSIMLSNMLEPRCSLASA
jgi:hypothetical protein